MEIKDDVFRVEVDNLGAEITTVSGDFKYEFKKGTRPHVTLLYLSKENSKEEILFLCRILYQSTTLIYSDAGYVKELMDLTSKWIDRIMLQAKIKAGEVTDSENKEALHEAASVIEKSNKKN